MKNKFLKAFAVILALMMMLMAFASCDMLNSNGGNEDSGSTTPQIKIGDDGFWYVSYDDGETWSSLGVSAKGEKGDKGDKGDDGAKGDKGDKGDQADIIDLTAHDGTDGLAFYLFPDDTYGVMAGTTKYMENIVIPATYNGKAVTQILPEAFYRANNLKSITIPNSVKSIGDNAFYSCSSLTSIIVDENNSSYKSIDGNLYSKDGKKLIQYAIGKAYTSFVIPNSVTSIGEGAFYNCSKLTSVEFKNTEGWKAGSTAISSTDLENKGTAATYLTSTYRSNTWIRS